MAGDSMAGERAANEQHARTEREKMLAGELYYSNDPELTERRLRTRERLARLTASDPRNIAARLAICGELFGSIGRNFWVEPPFFCDYGENIRLGDNCFINFNCTFLDVAPITLGNNVLIAPGVQLLAAYHPIDHITRAKALEYGSPITIEDDAWLGGGVIVLPGVRIGARSIIGAGSVVTRDVPPDVIAVGNPCKVLRSVG
ncbi:MAG: maltose acetyltransferase domain-containing protein [Planctomycetota bacterium]|nr:maltose acetyltransferase domain-containing protein [Planctomycetota bacterium]